MHIPSHTCTYMSCMHMQKRGFPRAFQSSTSTSVHFPLMWSVECTGMLKHLIVDLHVTKQQHCFTLNFWGNPCARIKQSSLELANIVGRYMYYNIMLPTSVINNYFLRCLFFSRCSASVEESSAGCSLPECPLPPGAASLSGRKTRASGLPQW